MHCLTLLSLPVLLGGAFAFGLDEFQVKREEIFEFVSKPQVTRDGDKVTIVFESKAFCDATVAIEHTGGRIVRHLASGVLGPNAPEPFQKDTKIQTVIWDGKDDAGVYVDDKENLTIRVSLGLKPQFERTLNWSPHKRVSNAAPLLASAPEGVYVADGVGVHHVRLFDHAGRYVRTLYPFPSDKIGEVVELKSKVFVQDNRPLPLKVGFERASFLTTGLNAKAGGHDGVVPATAMAVWKDRIALVYDTLNRLSTDGASGNLPLEGPKVSFPRDSKEVIAPTSIAFSPDGRRLYLTGYIWKTGLYNRSSQCYHLVMAMDYEKQDEPKVFVGAPKSDDGYGSGNDQFCVPLAVDCDALGRVYVADYVNCRIQIFSPDGGFLKTLPVPYPAGVWVERGTGEIWSFSWDALGVSDAILKVKDIPGKIEPVLCRLGTFEQPKKADPQPLPLIEGTGKGGWDGTGGQVFKFTVSKTSEEPALWIAGRQATIGLAESQHGGTSLVSNRIGWDARGIKIIRNEKGKWSIAQDFAALAREKAIRTNPPSFSRKRLYVNPREGMLYVCEDNAVSKSFNEVLQIDPESGGIKTIKLPFDAEDLVFGQDGMVYLKTDREIVRFEFPSWRDVLWDYGEERPKVRFDTSGSKPAHAATSALVIPGRRPVWWHGSGMWISPKRHLAVICHVPVQKPPASNPKERYVQPVSTKYTPKLYPGHGGGSVVLVFDVRGKLIFDDAAPGMTNADGIGIDKDDNLYIMVAASRLINGKREMDPTTETLIKFRPGQAKFICSGDAPIVLSSDMKPGRNADLWKYGMGNIWVEGAEWMYGGVGYGGQGGSCTCWHARFQLDFYARSFVPEVLRFNVAVLDTNGNLIMRMGRYGSVDDGLPLVRDGGPSQPRPLGGDEVALSHAAYVGVHTDRRLFIHDAGNDRIVSVKLGYHAEAKVAWKDVIPDRQAIPDPGR